METQQSWFKNILRAAALSFAVKIFIALTTYGTNDVRTWHMFLVRSELYGGIDLYHNVYFFNHPPFVIHLLTFIGMLVRVSQIPFPFWLRLPAILADLGSVVVVWRILALNQSFRREPSAVLLMALCPVSLMVSGFHGNTDSLMIFFVLSSVYFIESHASFWRAGFFLGLAINIKIVPVIFIPTLFLYLGNARNRTRFFAAAAITFMVTSIPFLIEDPFSILVRIFSYNSIAGQWGLSRFVALMVPGFFSSQAPIFSNLSKLVLMVLLMVVPVGLHRRENHVPLFLQLGLVVFLFVALAPGFGVQYLAWLVPWVVALGVRATFVYYLSSGTFLFLVYNFWSGGFPWYFADSIAVGSWSGRLVVWEVSSWLVIVFVMLLYLRTIRSYGHQSLAAVED